MQTDVQVLLDQEVGLLFAFNSVDGHQHGVAWTRTLYDVRIRFKTRMMRGGFSDSTAPAGSWCPETAGGVDEEDVPARVSYDATGQPLPFDRHPEPRNFRRSSRAQHPRLGMRRNQNLQVEGRDRRKRAPKQCSGQIRRGHKWADEPPLEQSPAFAQSPLAPPKFGLARGVRPERVTVPVHEEQSHDVQSEGYSNRDDPKRHARRWVVRGQYDGESRDSAHEEHEIANEKCPDRCGEGGHAQNVPGACEPNARRLLGEPVVNAEAVISVSLDLRQEERLVYNGEQLVCEPR